MILAKNDIVIKIKGDLGNLQQTMSKATNLIQNFNIKVNQSVRGGGGGIAGATQGIAGLDKAFGGLAGSVMKGFGLTTVLAAVTAAVAALATGFKAAVTEMINFNMNMEQTVTSFKVLMGSAKGAQYMVGKLYKFAADTPFEFPQITDAAKKMMAFGWSAKDAVKDLKSIGDAAASTGDLEEGMNRIVRALGQIKAKGRVQGEELLQMAELGIPAYQILQEKLGLTAKQVANIGREGIGADTAIKALLEGMKERYNGMMKEQANTAKGMLSTIKDNFRMILGGMGAGLFDTFKGIITNIRDFTDQVSNAFQKGGIRGVIEQILPPEWQNRIKDFFNIVMEYWNQMQPNFEKAGSVLGKLFGLIFDVFNALGPVFKQIWAQWGPVIGFLLDAIGAIVDIVSFVVKVIGALLKALTGDWKGAGKLIQEAWKTLCDNMVKFFFNFCGDIGRAFANAIRYLSTVCGGFFSGWVEGLHKTYEEFRKWTYKISKGKIKLPTWEMAKNGKDYFEETLKKTNPKKSNKGKQDYENNKGRPTITDTSFSEDGAKEAERKAKELAKARRELDMANFDAANKVQAEKLAEQSAQLEREYKLQLVSLEDYWKRRRQINEAQQQLEISEAQKKRDNAASDVAKLLKAYKGNEKKAMQDPEYVQALATLRDADTALQVSKLKLEELKKQNAADYEAAKRELAKARQDLEFNYKSATNSMTYDDFKKQAQAAYKELREQMAAQGDTEGMALIDKLIDIDAAKAQAYKLFEAVDRERAKYERERSKVENSNLTDEQKQEKINQLMMDYKKNVDGILPSLRQYAQATGDPEIIANVNDLADAIANLDTEAQKLKMDTMFDRLDDLQTKYELEKRKIEESKTLTADEKQARINALTAEYKNQVEALIPLLRQLAAATGNEEAMQKLEELEYEMSQLKTKTNEWAETLNESAYSNLEDFFNNGIEDCKNLGDAFKQMINNILKDLARLATQKLMNSLWSNFGLNIPGNATGGYIAGPGTGTSDSIISRLSNGEFVMPAARVRQFGVQFFETLRAGFLPTNVPRFATGGIVGGALAGATGGNHVTVPINISGVDKAKQLGSDLRRAIEPVVMDILRDQTKM